MPDTADPDDPDTIRIPFIFVPHGHPPPTEWLRDHPEAFRIPAIFVPRGDGNGFDIQDGNGFDIQGAADATGPAGRPVAATLASATRHRPGFAPPTLLPDAVEDYKRLQRWWRQRTGPQWESHPRPIDAPDAPIIVEANPRPGRNDGLPPELQAQPSRYRPAALKSENERETVERSKGLQMSVHHLIGVKPAQSHKRLLMAAARIGWSLDEPDNLMLLPATPDAQQQLAKQGPRLPLHNSGHPGWTDGVDARLSQIEAELDKPETGLAKRSASGSADEYDLAAWMAVKMLQAKLRKEALDLSRIVQNDEKGQAAS